MGWWRSQFFRWVQAAPFYEALHRETVALAPRGEGKTWLDVGCGPGLVTRLAAERGYAACGLDTDPAMIALARRLATGNSAGPRFAVGNLFDPSDDDAGYDVVSATSLLAVLPDRVRALRALRARVRPTGLLLLVEPSAHLTIANAEAYLQRHPDTRGALVLRLWACTRRPGKAVSDEVLALPGADVTVKPLLDGMVNAYAIRFHTTPIKSYL